MRRLRGILSQAMELPGVPSDTHRDVRSRVIAGLRALGVEGRLEQTMTLFRTANELAIAGILHREGPLEATDLRQRLATLRYGVELVARVEAHRQRTRA
jgi:hypothetical protein